MVNHEKLLDPNVQTPLTSGLCLMASSSSGLGLVNNITDIGEHWLLRGSTTPPPAPQLGHHTSLKLRKQCVMEKRRRILRSKLMNNKNQSNYVRWLNYVSSVAKSD